VKAAELRELSQEELYNRLETLRRENYNLRFRGVVEQIEDNSIFHKNRREIASILTIINEKKVQEMAEKAGDE
jgi:large subunit ribosomal protein L29